MYKLDITFLAHQRERERERDARGMTEGGEGD